MKLKYRLVYYLFGLLLGLFFVIKFLGAKAEAKGVEFCYLPNCRVLKELRNKSLNFSPEAQATLEENWINLDDIRNTLKYGDVDFSKSNKPYKNGKIYLIEGKTTQNEEINITMINYTSKVILEKIEKK
ncbi:DUF4258 domain-containing protein [Flavobacterium jejuense]|uniref:DUF4258 domain-containing protein n=1 Tax=Flavobacterium jejuense TaxID=1544455 RepID=A0ABX0ISV5_9FLAO|nr:DUF4258 domain-containing protein [Flavobacterium jejuense]NHN25894.1 DUF4258 domain-containing protein [Flavobacterium jejuense]